MQGVPGATWVLRALLACAGAVLVGVLTAVWSAAPAHAEAPSPDDLLGGVSAALAPVAATALAPVVDVAQPVVDRVAAPVVAQVAGPLVAPVAQVTDSLVAPVAQVAAPLLAPVAQAAAPVVAPVAQAAAPVVAPVVEVAAPLVAPVAQIAAPLVAPVAQNAAKVVAPVAQILTPVVQAVTPIVAGAFPVPEPVVDDLPPVAGATGSLPLSDESAGIPLFPSAGAPASPDHVRAAADGTGVTARPSAVDPAAGPLARVASAAEPDPLRSLHRPPLLPRDGVGLPTSGSASAGTGRGGVDGDVPSAAAPPVLRGPSTRAGPGPAPVAAPAPEVLDSPA
ncbi:hypothetical protein [Cellulomonas sp. ICMP 17802]|uniref:hypothetical protein n=1 Tax=Cellulomonas sp. ICMP 17802 TaxID=3239199 RepID=UPI00351AC0EB